jgi:hypothetical protein
MQLPAMSVKCGITWTCQDVAGVMFLSVRPLLNSLGLRASRMGIDRANPI